MEFPPSPDSLNGRQPDPATFHEDPGFAGDRPCQRCGATPARMNGYMWVMSFLLLTRHAEYEALLCRSCSTRQALREQVKSGVLGWWGFPWGLLTFKALWINSRTLLRWSNQPILALATLLLALAVPASVGWFGYLALEEEQTAKARGDWASDEVAARVEEGHRLYADGNLEGALEAYLDAHREVPRSHAVNDSLADVYWALGDAEKAREHIARAETIVPTDAGTVAFHGWLLTSAGEEEAARERVERLRSLEPEDVAAAAWMADFLEAMGEFGEQMRAVDAGLALEPGHPQLEARRVVTLAELGRLEEAERALAALPAETAASPIGLYAARTYRMRTEPLAEVDRLLATWGEEGYSDATVASWLTVAGQAGELEAVRQRIAAHLFAADTPGEAWATARPWFAEDAWPRLLDRYLADRDEALPGLLRLQLYDPMQERDALVALADRMRRLDHPLAGYAELYYFGYGPPGEPSRAASVAALERHVAAAPDHVVCRFRLAGALTRLEPQRAGALLAELERESVGDEPALAAEIAVQRAELELLQGQAAEALRRIAGIDPGAAAPYTSPGQVHLLAAEIAFHAGDDREFEERLAEIAATGEAGAHAAALVLRWSHQLASRRPVSYRRDVAGYLKRYGQDAVARETSPSAQGILVAEGRVERQAVEPLIRRESRSTLDLVALLRDAGHDRTDRDTLARLAARPERHEYAPMIARRVVERSALR